ncbi:hypothetical protein AT727_19120 [Desulfitobacterium hafniense]|uniref:CopZ zinc binding domain-containing protein n=1 Tax=Desulfitobacterium hafniense TaxID=49338 RepID=A0A0W1JLM9_DESHA|nr:copper chaperone Copz family protein [Desulfitobacterium hafniense]KTE92466.1 hypothetical protein AT727_19120 [Desulfitobacterium hafniense]
MEDCCVSNNNSITIDTEINCPRCGSKGKDIKIITIKSLLLPEALATLDASENYRMCSNQKCDVIYFNDKGGIFQAQDLKVPVFLKNDDQNCPVCYCFGWTREKLKADLEKTGSGTAENEISGHIKAGRCVCEVNNPEGSCCLNNVKKYLASLLEI